MTSITKQAKTYAQLPMHLAGENDPHVLEVLVKKWPKTFTSADVAGMINTTSTPNNDEQTLRDYLLPGASPHHTFTTTSVGRLLKRHRDEPVKSGGRTFVLRAWWDTHLKVLRYRVDVT